MQWRKHVQTPLQQRTERLVGRLFFINAPIIKHSNGGIVRWNLLKKQIETTLQNERDAIVTLLIDYYGLYQKHGFPKWEEAETIADKNVGNRDGSPIRLAERIGEPSQFPFDEKLRYRFIPYIQLHEFEGLLFCDSQVFQNVIGNRDGSPIRLAERIGEPSQFPLLEYISQCTRYQQPLVEQLNF